MLALRSLAVLVAFLPLAACTPPLGTSSGFGPAAGVSPARGLKTAHGKSWFNTAAQQSTLLYVSNTGGVTVYTYAGNNSFTLVGELFGFQIPAGECTDARGNVFITDEAARAIVEYGHGSITPKAVIPDTQGQPLSCAIDRTTGHMAVTNYSNPSGAEPGNIVVYTLPSGTATEYSDPHLYEPLYCAFDRKGNLFVNAYDDTFHGALGELRKGNPNFTILTLSGGTLNIPGWVQTKGTQLLMGDLYDPKTSSIYQLSVSGSTATVVGKIALSNTQTLAQFTLFDSGSATAIIAPDNDYNNVQIYSYPGGSSLGSFTSGLSQPVGTAISE